MQKFISKDKFRTLFSSDPIYVFDTNIYMNLLRYSKHASLDALSLYESCNNIFVPVQVQKEFDKNFKHVSGERINKAKESITASKNAVNTFKTNFGKQILYLERNKYVDIEKLSLDINTLIDEIKKKIEYYKKQNIEGSIIDEKIVFDFFNKCSEPFKNNEISFSELMSIYTEGDLRYRYQIPPGYMDDPRNNKQSTKEGTQVFGDLILWKELLSFCIDKKNSIIFVTSDIKEDWFELKKDKPMGPRNELYSEFLDVTGYNNLCILTGELFIEYMSDILGIENQALLAEIKGQAVVDRLIKSYKAHFSNQIQQWLNQQESLDFKGETAEINQIDKVELSRIFAEDISIAIAGECCEYTVLCRCLLDLTGRYKYQDENITSNTVSLNDIKSDIMFNIKLPLENALGKKMIEEDKIIIEAKSIELEYRPDLPPVINSVRGIFVEPSEVDRRIYDYMESIWDSYEAKYSTDDAEARVFMDAALHFDTNLLSVNRSYTLIQNQISSISLSLNEMDSLALRRFEVIGFEIDGNVAEFDGKKIQLGKSLDAPESHKKLLPIDGQELDVTFNVTHKIVDGKYVIINGVTSLPESTLIMITLKGSGSSYSAQSKVSVDKTGNFISDVFKNAKNSDSMKLEKGLYNVNLIVPIVAVQPDPVQIAIGKKGRNLIGKNVSYDEIYGNSIKFNYSLEI